MYFYIQPMNWFCLLEDDKVFERKNKREAIKMFMKDKWLGEVPSNRIKRFMKYSFPIYSFIVMKVLPKWNWKYIRNWNRIHFWIY
jgi:AAA+ superfamily predicted ATPase